MSYLLNDSRIFSEMRKHNVFQYLNVYGKNIDSLINVST